MKDFDEIFMAWRSGKSERRHIVGVIKQDSAGKFVFNYLKEKISKAKEQGFSPYTEFPDIEKTYNGNVLEILNQRLTKAERSDIQTFYDFWEIDNNLKDDKFYLLGHTQGLVPTDNFEFLADYNPVPGIHFLTEIAGLSKKNLPAETVKKYDILRFELEATNLHDPEAVKVFKGDTELGYIKKIHCRIFHKPKADKLKLQVKAVDKNGTIKRIFVKVAF